MASIKFYYRSKKGNANLTLRFSHRSNSETDFDIFTKIPFTIDKKEWIEINKKNIKDATYKNLSLEIKTELVPLENHILKNIPKDESEINKDWLIETINNYYNPIEVLNTSVKYWIQRYIDKAHTFDNDKGGTGLGKSRIKSYQTFKENIMEFDSNLKVNQCNTDKFDEYKEWLIEKGYAPLTFNKKLSDLKTICKYALSKGVEASKDLLTIKIKKGKVLDDDMDVITLSEHELNTIANLKLDKLHLINARKWLILACYTGQRGNSLLNNVVKENFKNYGDNLLIRFKQSKGNKTVKIPVLPKVKDIFENGLPYKVSLQKLNTYFKQIGKIAEIDTPTIGKIREKIEISKDKSIQRKVKKTRPKWMYITSHIGRRSFATNHYNKLPTPLIMRVTGHEKEHTFLEYINQSNDDHLDAFFDYYKTKLEERETPIKDLKRLD